VHQINQRKITQTFTNIKNNNKRTNSLKCTRPWALMKLCFSTGMRCGRRSASYSRNRHIYRYICSDWIWGRESAITTARSSEGNSAQLDLYIKGRKGMANVRLVRQACYAVDALGIPTQRRNRATYYIRHYANYGRLSVRTWGLYTYRRMTFVIINHIMIQMKASVTQTITMMPVLLLGLIGVLSGTVI